MVRKLFFCFYTSSWGFKRFQVTGYTILMRLTYRPTNMCKAIYRSFFKGGIKLEMCLRNTDAPGSNKVNMAKSLSPKFWPHPTPRGMWCQWGVSNPKMNLQSKFGYCITTQTLIIALFIEARRNYRQMDKQTDGHTDGRTDDPITRCPRQTFQAEGIKIRTSRNCYGAHLNDQLIKETFVNLRNFSGTRGQIGLPPPYC